jgi:hypothetical protein
MKMNEEHVRTMCMENRKRSWLEVPSSCPAELRARIAEYRVAVMSGKIKETRATKSLHRTAVVAVTEQEKMRLLLVSQGIL